MAAEQLIYEYSRQISPAASPAGVVHYFTNDAQIFLVKSSKQYVQNVRVNEGDWSDFDADLWGLMNMEPEISTMRLDHPAFGQVFAIQSDMTFLLYVYAGDISDMVDVMEITEQADNQIKGLSFNLLKTGNAMLESEATLFLPGAEITVSVAMGNNVDYYEMGRYFLDSAPYDPFAAALTYQGRSVIGRLKDSTFDTNLVGGGVQATFTGTCGAISKEILTTYSDGEIAESDIVTNLVTELTVNFQPNENVLNNFNKWLLSIGWAMVELFDGRYIVGPPIELISLYRPNHRYTFTRNQDIFTRRIDRNIDGAYSRVCVKYGDPAAYEYRDTLNYDYWFVPFHKTYHYDAPEGTDQANAALIAEALASQLQYIGIREQCFGLFRPWLITGDLAQIQEGEVVTVIGQITEIKHQLGKQGFFTTFITDSGGDILSEVDGVLTMATASGIYGANRMRRITDFIKKQ
jgi:hypothetical protein